jgi:hypothetical protein
VYSRAYRTALIITTTLTLMFVNAVLYDVSYPDAHCEDISTESECLLKSSPLNQGSGACIFDPTTGTTQSISCSSAIQTKMWFHRQRYIGTS